MGFGLFILYILHKTYMYIKYIVYVYNIYVYNV